jgi:hypothetical protein
MKRFSPAKVTATTIAMTAVAVIVTAAIAGATMTTTALASSTTVHHSARNAKTTKDAKTTKHEGGTETAKATAATKVATAAKATETAKGIAATAARVVSESRNKSGTYLTVVTCSGKTMPPPVVVTKSRPFTVKGAINTKSVTNALAHKPSDYTPVYTCTVTVLKKLPPVCSNGKSVVKGLTGHGVCLTPQQELAWFVSQAVSDSGPKSNACLIARKLAGKGDKTAHKAERFACAVKVVLNTGFGGAAGSVSHHHPRR